MPGVRPSAHVPDRPRTRRPPALPRTFRTVQGLAGHLRFFQDEAHQEARREFEARPHRHRAPATSPPPPTDESDENPDLADDGTDLPDDDADDLPEPRRNLRPPAYGLRLYNGGCQACGATWTYEYEDEEPEDCPKCQQSLRLYRCTGCRAAWTLDPEEEPAAFCPACGIVFEV